MHGGAPYTSQFTTANERAALLLHLADRTAYLHEVDAEIALDRSRRELHGLREADNEAYTEQLEAMAPEELEGYTRWERLWDSVLTGGEPADADFATDEPAAVLAEAISSVSSDDFNDAPVTEKPSRFIVNLQLHDRPDSSLSLRPENQAGFATIQELADHNPRAAYTILAEEALRNAGSNHDEMHDILPNPDVHEVEVVLGAMRKRGLWNLLPGRLGKRLTTIARFSVGPTDHETMKRRAAAQPALV